MANINSKLMSLLNKECNELFSSIIDYCDRSALSTVTVELLVDQFVRSEDTDVADILYHFRLNRETLANDLAAAVSRTKPESGRFKGFDADVLKLLKESWFFTSVVFSENRIRSGHMLLELAENHQLHKRLVACSDEFNKIQPDELIKNYADIVSESTENQFSQQSDVQHTGGEGVAQFGTATALARFGIDMTEQARLGQSDPIVGRDSEVREMITCLMRRRQNNPIMVGEAGVGKTAVVEALAQRLVANDVPPALQGAMLVSLDIGLLQAGASMKGEFEQRLKQVIDEVQSSEQLIILFIDEAHTLIGAGGSQGTGDAANLLKPALARGTLRTVAATTNAEYKAFIEPDPALVRRFQVIRIDEPNEADAIRMMRAIAPSMSEHHDISIDNEAIKASVELSHRYIPSRQLPDKSISLLDTASARVSVSRYAVPAQVERSRSQIQAYESELAMLGELTLEDAEERAQLEGLLSEEHLKLENAENRWKRELVLVDRILAALPHNSHNVSNAESSNDKDNSAENKITQENSETSGVLVAELQNELVQLQNEDPMVFATVDRQAVAAVVQDWTGIPVGRVLTSQLDTILNLDKLLEERVIGQSHALAAIAQSVQTTRAGLDKPDKPTGVFMFAGTSGVGKTETAKALAELIYGGENRLIVINMSEFKTPETVTTLKGPPPGYVGNEKGGILTEAVKRNPYSVVLLDEIEKAHSDGSELFFRVFDEGVMDDSNGVEVDFRNVIFILTTNAGTELVMSACDGGSSRPSIDSILESIQVPLEDVFSPAFIGRVQVIPFYPLDGPSLKRIVRLQLDRIVKRVAKSRDIPFHYSEDAVELVAGRCQNSESGGRSIDLILNKTLLPEISRELLMRSVNDEVVTRIDVSVAESRFVYKFD